MSELWLVPLGIGAGGALLLVVAVKRLNSAVAGLRASMRPLRTNSPHARHQPGARPL